MNANEIKQENNLKTKKMKTVKDLIQILNMYPQDFIITDEQNRTFTHIINGNDCVVLSSVQPIGICNRSGGYVYPSLVKGYAGFSQELDEDLYEFEINRDMSEMRED